MHVFIDGPVLFLEFLVIPFLEMPQIEDQDEECKGEGHGSKQQEEDVVHSAKKTVPWNEELMAGVGRGQVDIDVDGNADEDL